MAAEQEGQKGWRDYGLEDLRHIDIQHNIQAPDEIKRAETIEEAVNILAHTFGLVEGVDETTLKTCIGDIIVARKNLEHIVEKRAEARERYANHALTTVLTPFEVWLTEYNNNAGTTERRYVFISLFNSKRQIMVVVSFWEQNILWNLMHSDKKNLNKHRHGELIYQSLERQKAANE